MTKVYYEISGILNCDLRQVHVCVWLSVNDRARADLINKYLKNIYQPRLIQPVIVHVKGLRNIKK